MNYSQAFTEALDMLAVLSQHPQVIDAIVQTTIFDDFKTLLALHIEDLHQ